jgi:hypothetical protein
MQTLAESEDFLSPTSSPERRKRPQSWGSTLNIKEHLQGATNKKDLIQGTVINVQLLLNVGYKHGDLNILTSP